MFINTGFHRAAGSEDGGDIQTHCAHKHTGNDFVAVGYADHGVEGMGGTHAFNRVGNNFTAGQRIFHTGMSHSDTVADCDSIEFVGDTACFADFFTDDLTDFLQMTMSGYDVGIGVANTDERFFDVFGFDAGSHHQSAVRGSLQTCFHSITSHKKFLSICEKIKKIHYFI